MVYRPDAEVERMSRNVVDFEVERVVCEGSNGCRSSAVSHVAYL